MQFIQTDLAPAAIGPYSQGVDIGNLLFFSGQIALKTDGTFLNGDIVKQAKQVLKNIAGLLKSQGLTKKNVVKCTMFLDDMNNFKEANEVYAEFFGDHKPARSTIEVAKLPLNAKIEIEVIAVRLFL